MTQAKQGDIVKVRYTGKLADGTTFDSSAEHDPLEFTLGAGEVIAGFEAAVLGMTPGESRTTTIPAGEAYGDYHDEMLLEIARDSFPAHLEPEVGQELQVKQGDGEAISVVITEMDEASITLDANHPLAGKDLTFEIELLAIA
jgi:FKBP-type peptidyl-prolyl cis-trans isomerase 2